MYIGNIEFYSNENKRIAEIDRLLAKDESTICKKIKNFI